MRTELIAGNYDTKPHRSPPLQMPDWHFFAWLTVSANNSEDEDNEEEEEDDDEVVVVIGDGWASSRPWYFLTAATPTPTQQAAMPHNNTRCPLISLYFSTFLDTTTSVITSFQPPLLDIISTISISLISYRY